MKTRVVQARQKGVTGYRLIGRPGKFGNPFRVRPILTEAMFDGFSIEDVLRKYEAYLRERLGTDPAFRAAFLALRGQTLGCPCPGAAADPKDGERCHGHVMARVLEGMGEN